VFVDPTTHEDDEYSRAGEVDPKILITTSRDPSSRLQQFAKVHFAVSFNAVVTSKQWLLRQFI
jgi:hypothetical protein